MGIKERSSSDMRTADETGTIDEKASLKHIEHLTGVPEAQLDREVGDYAPRIRGRFLTFSLAFVAGTGFTLFGYVHSVGLYALSTSCSWHLQI